MTNEQKRELRQLINQGYSFREIKGIVNCADSTIRQYIKIFAYKKVAGCAEKIKPQMRK